MTCTAGCPSGLSPLPAVTAAREPMARPGFVRSLALINPVLNAQIFALQPPAVGRRFDFNHVVQHTC